jgi:hypothetical protein
LVKYRDLTYFSKENGAQKFFLKMKSQKNMPRFLEGKFAPEIFLKTLLPGKEV